MILPQFGEDKDSVLKTYRASFGFEALKMKHDGKDYSYSVGSDVIRDGMFVEVSDEANGHDVIIEIYYSDVDHKMSVTLYKPDVPLDVVEWAIAIARKRLPAAYR